MQQRLDIESRSKTTLDRDYEQEMEALAREIRETKREKNNKLFNLKQRRKQQQKGLQMGEEPVTHNKIRELTRKFDQQIRVLEKKYANLKQTAGKVSEAAKSQQDLF